MNNLTKTNVIDGGNTNLTPIEIMLGVDNEGRTTARKLYEFLGLDKGSFARWAKTNILENLFAIDGEDYLRVCIDAETPTGGKVKREDYKLSASFAKKLAMGTHNERGEQAKNYFIKVEDKLKQKNINISQLSPELQMFKQIFDSVAEQQLKQKMLQQSVTETKKEVQRMRDVISIIPSDEWRNKTNTLVNRICMKLKDYEKPKNEIYKAIEQRGACDLRIRLKNLKGRALLNGSSKSKADKLNILDVISEDKKLIEIYTAIVKEMAIKYKVA